MARIEDAADGLKALAKHHAPILDAYLNNRGALLDTEENQPVVKALLKHHLAWQLDPEEPLQLSRALTPTLAAVTRSYRMSSADLSVGHLWQEIEEAISSYQDAKRRGAYEDSETYLGTAFDIGHQLIETLREAIAHFSHHIGGGFTHIHNLDLRANENRKMINRAARLNDILETFDYADLHAKAGSDTNLRRLLLRALPRALEQCRKELLFAIERLTDMLHIINRQQRKSRLIESVLQLYQGNHTYAPSLDDLDQIPPMLNRAEPLMIASRADIRNPDHELQLADIAEKLPTLSKLEVETFTPEPVVDALAAQEEVVTPDPIRSAALEMLSLVNTTQAPISARKVYEVLDLQCDKELWFMALVNEVYGLPDLERSRVYMRFIEEQDSVFTGNYWVSDIELQQSARDAFG